jgi:HAD superfamily hydrolase (TIGR01509 family)
MLNLRSIRGIIFDLDGVLIQSADCHRAAFCKVLERFDIHDFEYAPYAGWRTAEVVEDVLRRHGQHVDPKQVAQAARDKSDLAREMLDRTKPIVPGAERALATLASRYPLALASSGSRPSIDAFLKVTGSASLFRSILSGSDVVRAKPDPEIYRRSAEQLGFSPGECLIIEDSVAGVAAARASGAVAVGVAPDGAVRRELLEAGATHVITSPCELPGLLFEEGPPPIDPSLWTAVIPAAGRGSRLGFHRAKLLYPVAGRPILDWLLDLLRPNCGSLVFVLSPEGVADVASELDRRIPGRYEIVVQETPTGMGDAVALGLDRVSTPHTAVVWGDQVALRLESIQACMRLQQGPLRPDATVPTVMRTAPYIHFERDAAGAITRLLQAREGDTMPAEGESDTGFFCFRTDALRGWLGVLRDSPEATGRGTNELNLLPVIPMGARQGRVLTPRCVRVEETVGINSPQDAGAIEEFLRRSHATGH